MYYIGDIRLQIENYNLEYEWKPFEKQVKDRETDCLVHIRKLEKITHGIECYTLTGHPVHVCKLEQDVMLVSEDWREAEILQPSSAYCVKQLLLQLFYAHAIRRRMIQVHSALVDYNGDGLMFLGPSGIGKTTQAELWNWYRSARIINGDVVFLQETEAEEKKFLGWGTPWHGSSPYCINHRVQVKALIVLKQAEENRIRRLTGFEAVAEVSGSIFYPGWVEDGTELCLDILNHVLKGLPVYELSCRPDEAAVALTERTIFGE